MIVRHLVTALLLSTAVAQAAVPGGDALAALIEGEFDTNADSLIDSGEWQTGISASFDKLDTNADGSLALDEADSLKSDIAPEAGELGAAVVVALIRQVLIALDTDNNQLVSREEFNQLSGDVFAKLDTDKSNGLNRAELANIPLHLGSK